MNSIIKIFFIFLIAIFLTAPKISFAQNARIEYVKNQLIEKGFATTTINGLFSDKRIALYPAVTVAYKEPNWNALRLKIFSRNSISTGLDYIEKNKSAFEQAEINYGISKGILAGVIAIETDFGKNTGSYSTFNVLYSKMEQKPENKWQGSAKELISLSSYCLEAKIDCFKIKGSYAGAIGLVQFMPSSLLAYGIDANNDGFIDLSKPIDAINSAANYLKQNGWQKSWVSALGRYYGTTVAYPEIVIAYGSFLDWNKK